MTWRAWPPSLRRTGLPVTVQVRGHRRPLPDRVELSAFRIVQEALTNVVRHADRAPAEVELQHQPDRLIVQVSDEGPGVGAAIPGGSGRGGHGIAGMRERVALLGGELTVGPRRPAASGCGLRSRVHHDQDSAG